MPGETRLTATRLREGRERAIATLQEHFAHDNLDMDEFERRVTEAHASDTLAAIENLTADLDPIPGGANGVVPATNALLPASAVTPVQTIRGLMSATTRAGSWSVPRRLEVRAVMSSSVLDFREARLPAGTIDLEIRAVMSSVEIIVPPGLAVETHGAAIMGTFDEVDRSPANPDPDAPLLRIHGRAVLASVEVKMRLPGESERQSHHRQRKELRSDGERRRALPPANRPPS